MFEAGVGFAEGLRLQVDRLLADGGFDADPAPGERRPAP